jgi:hypothetical protein
VDPSSGELISVIWGSNKKNTVAPNLPTTDTVRTPSSAEWLRGVALRDLTMYETYAACVDAKGDVYQWGEGFAALSPTAGPTVTLRGKVRSYALATYPTC